MRVFPWRKDAAQTSATGVPAACEAEAVIDVCRHTLPHLNLQHGRLDLGVAKKVFQLQQKVSNV